MRTDSSLTIFPTSMEDNTIQKNKKHVYWAANTMYIHRSSHKRDETKVSLLQ